MKTCYLLLVLSLSAFSAHAQTDSVKYSPWYFDFTIGVNQSKLSGSEVDFMQGIVTSHKDGKLKMTSQTGIDVGILTGRRLGKYFNVKSGLQVMQRGVTLENTGYVEKPAPSSLFVGVPFMLGAHSHSFTSEKGFGIFVEGGVSYLFNASDNSNGWVTETYSILDVVVEAGVEFSISPKLTAGLRYTYMDDLNHAYTFARQYSDGTGNLNLRRNYDYYYSTNTFSASLRLKFEKE
jgi:opacity protein-like surface antigen